MLKSIDILIGFAVIMLAVSMSVTLIINAILQLLGMRGKKLLEGITHLLQQVDPQLLTPERAKEIAGRILRHPLLAPSPTRCAEVIQREELIKVVLQIAAGAPAAGAAGTTAADAPGQPQGPATAEQALALALARAGIPDPGNTLQAVRLFSMRLEASRPELATHVREAVAVITEAESQFVANVNGWFDQTMDRVSHSFTTHSRYWIAGVSLIVALGLQLDAFKVVNRLSMDDKLRLSLVEQAQSSSPPPVPAVTPNQPALDAATKANLDQLRHLATDKLITWPGGWTEWNNGWKESSVFGVLLSAALLSLGAPFWFNVLGDLLKLRPGLAAKEDEQRRERETSQTPAGGGAATMTIPTGGERGDLSAG